MGKPLAPPSVQQFKGLLGERTGGDSVHCVDSRSRGFHNPKVYPTWGDLDGHKPAGKSPATSLEPIHWMFQVASSEVPWVW